MALTPFGFGRTDLFAPTFGGVEELFGPLFRPLETTTVPTFRDLAPPRAMAVDVKETDNNFLVKADIPGVKKEDINISVDGNVLNLRVDSKSEKEEEKEEEGTKWHRIERHSVFVNRSLRMPETAKMDDIKARYENGVLQLEVGKKKTDGEKAVTRIEVA